MKFSNIARTCTLLSLLAIYTNAHAIDAVLTWTDNSGGNPAINDAETSFILQRNVAGGAFATIATPAASPGAGATVQFIDANLSQGSGSRTYCYQVAATNSAGTSAFTPQVCKTVPPTGTTPPPPPLVIPAGPTGLLVQ